MIVCLFSDIEDPVVTALKRHDFGLAERITYVSVSDLLINLAIYDDIQGDKLVVKWALPDGEVIDSRASSILINRALKLDSKLFNKHFHPNEASAQKEFWAYLSRALPAFSRITAKPSSMGIFGHTVPLHIQWQAVDEMSAVLKTPRYHLGRMKNLDPQMQNDRIVLGEPSNLHLWTPEAGINCYGRDDDYIFAYERPKGLPIVSFFCGNEFFSRTADSSPVERWLLPVIEHELKAIKRLFDLSLGESILFENNGEITFGMCSSCPSNFMSSDSRFDEVLLKGLKGMADVN